MQGHTFYRIRTLDKKSKTVRPLSSRVKSSAMWRSVFLVSSWADRNGDWKSSVYPRVIHGDSDSSHSVKGFPPLAVPFRAHDTIHRERQYQTHLDKPMISLDISALGQNVHRVRNAWIGLYIETIPVIVVMDDQIKRVFRSMCLSVLMLFCLTNHFYPMCEPM